MLVALLETAKVPWIGGRRSIGGLRSWGGEFRGALHCSPLCAAAAPALGPAPRGRPLAVAPSALGALGGEAFLTTSNTIGCCARCSKLAASTLIGCALYPPHLTPRQGRHASSAAPGSSCLPACLGKTGDHPGTCHLVIQQGLAHNPWQPCASVYLAAGRQGSLATSVRESEGPPPPSSCLCRCEASSPKLHCCPALIHRIHQFCGWRRAHVCRTLRRLPPQRQHAWYHTHHAGLGKDQLDWLPSTACCCCCTDPCKEAFSLD